jgi:hypothetical protein
MATQEAPRVPRPFQVHWGRGSIVEEAGYEGQYHEPRIQLLEFEDGSLSIRFCYYNHSGRFQRSPLMVGLDELDSLREALNGTPRLRLLLKQIVG